MNDKYPEVDELLDVLQDKFKEARELLAGLNLDPSQLNELAGLAIEEEFGFAIQNSNAGAQSAVGTSAIPEPSCAGLLMLGLLGALRRRRRA